MEITGTIIKVEMKEREPYEGQSRYSPNTTTTEKFLKVTLDDGDMRYYFNTPVARMNVSVAPGCAIVTYQVKNGAAQWVQEVGDNRIATPGQKNGNRLESLVNEGDEITISGRVTIKTSRYGNKYGTLTHVKRLSRSQS